MNKTVRRTAAAAIALPLLAGCGAAGATYVRPGDPALSVCQALTVQNNTVLVQSVDYANNTAGWNGSGAGQRLTSDQIAFLKQAAFAYRALAGQVGAHPGFAAALRNEAQEFTVAASSPTGLTTNTVAVAADKFSGEIQADCASFQVGAEPKAGKPGPGLWNWGVFWVALGGYLIMGLAASYLIAVGERRKPRARRLAAGQIAALALVWWVTIFTATARAWGHAISSATLTRDEKKDDRIAAQQEEIARLEARLRKPEK